MVGRRRYRLAAGASFGLCCRGRQALELSLQQERRRAYCAGLRGHRPCFRRLWSPVLLRVLQPVSLAGLMGSAYSGQAGLLPVLPQACSHFHCGSLRSWSLAKYLALTGLWLAGLAAEAHGCSSPAGSLPIRGHSAAGLIMASGGLRFSPAASTPVLRKRFAVGLYCRAWLPRGLRRRLTPVLQQASRAGLAVMARRYGFTAGLAAAPQQAWSWVPPMVRAPASVPSPWPTIPASLIASSARHGGPTMSGIKPPVSLPGIQRPFQVADGPLRALACAWSLAGPWQHPSLRAEPVFLASTVTLSKSGSEPESTRQFIYTAPRRLTQLSCGKLSTGAGGGISCWLILTPPVCGRGCAPYLDPHSPRQRV